MAKPLNRKTCPICDKATEEPFKPFCSKRCADVDLRRWLSGSYAIPVTEDEDEDGSNDESSGSVH
jgi:hypothetical protein